MTDFEFDFESMTLMDKINAHAEEGGMTQREALVLLVDMGEATEEEYDELKDKVLS